MSAADTVTTPRAEEEPAKELTSEGAETTSPKTEEKGGLKSFLKKTEARLAGKKEEKKEESAAEAGALKDDPAAAEQTPATTEERPAREKRRTSLFGSLGTLKKKTDSTENGSEDATETKREKSPLPAKLGGLFRKPSKAVKPTEELKESSTTTEAAEAATTNGETTEGTTTVLEPTESKIVGDQVPEDFHAAAPEQPVEPAKVEAAA